ncbi:MAG: TorF family putative porin [Pseudomonadota bacterium]
MMTKSKWALLALAAAAGTAQAGDFTANIAVTNNYVWRGLTQTQNEAAVQGGIDWAHESGFYVGTWISNVSYATDDVYSYEHDVYFGLSGGDDLAWDVGYLYFNYDDDADFDFAEIYGSLSFSNYTVGLNVLAHTEADEPMGRDYSFGDAYWVYGDAAFEVREGLELGLHVGYHDGDFVEDFNGVPDSYFEYGVSLSMQGVTVAVTGTDVDDPGPDDPLGNDDIRFVISYGMDFEL